MTTGARWYKSMNFKFLDKTATAYVKSAHQSWRSQLGFYQSFIYCEYVM